jgi:bifunctional non-homologous end joining protein LigD
MPAKPERRSAAGSHPDQEAAPEGLASYRRKRTFDRTPEPESGRAARSGTALRFVVQEHHARRLHWDFRLERDGVLVSWALPKGVPTDPRRNHLAVHVEDHPLDYIDFAGQIPAGEYGGGQVSIWDQGTYETEKWRPDASKGEVMVTLHGARAQGRYVLFQTDGKNWMIHRMDPRAPEAGAALPERVQPMLARASDDLPLGRPDEWAFEYKWDGVRALAACTPGDVRLQSRTGQDITTRYPEVRRLMEAVGGHSLLLDGEIVAFDRDGVPRFERLQQRLGLSQERDVRAAMRETPVVYLIFDLLHLDGRDTMPLPYRERRRLLEDLNLNGSTWHTPEQQVGEGQLLLDAARDRGLEGVVAKRTGSRYEPGGRSGDWVKVKVRRGQELVIAGWQEGQGKRRGLPGALLVGYYEESGLHYAGKVGTGFTDAVLERLQALLEPLERRDSPYAPSPHLPKKDVHFVEPRLVGEFKFAEWTQDGQLRAPAFKGLREDKDAASVVRELSPGKGG